MVSTAVHRSNGTSMAYLCSSFTRRLQGTWAGHDGHGPKPRDVMGYVDDCRCLISSLEEVVQNMSQPKSSWEIEANQRYKILAVS